MIYLVWARKIIIVVIDSLIDDVTYVYITFKPPSVEKKHRIRHVSPGKKTSSHGKIAYTFWLAAKTKILAGGLRANHVMVFVLSEVTSSIWRTNNVVEAFEQAKPIIGDVKFASGIKNVIWFNPYTKVCKGFSLGFSKSGTMLFIRAHLMLS